jgi:hypothetical protein
MRRHRDGTRFGRMFIAAMLAVAVVEWPWGAAEHSTGIVLKVNQLLLPAPPTMRAELVNLRRSAGPGRWHCAMPG